MGRRTTQLALSVTMMAVLLLPQTVFASDALTDPVKIKEACKQEVQTVQNEVCSRAGTSAGSAATRQACINRLIEECYVAYIARQEEVKALNNAAAIKKREILPNRITSQVRGLDQLGVKNVSDFTSRVIRVALSFMGTLALVMFIYGGILWMFSQGNGEKAKKATKVIIWSALGLIVIISSYAIINFILEAFTP